MLILPGNKQLTLRLKEKPLKENTMVNIMFVILMILLIFWAFWGKAVEKKYYDPKPVLDQNDYFGAILGLSSSTVGESDVVISQISPDSPAMKAGLAVGDKIKGIDGYIINSLEMAQYTVSTKQKGTVMKVAVQRNGKIKTVYVHLDPYPLSDPLLKAKKMPLTKQILVGIVFIKITVVMFFLIYKNMINRTYIVLFFAGCIVLMGLFFRIYTPVDAFFSIKFNTISLLLGMGVISIILDQTGFFDQIAYKIYHFAGDNYKKIFILLCLVTYLFSLLVNNLTTILVVVPMTLNLAFMLKFDPRPMIIGEVISSNLGGASTMVGDFPNMLISSEAGVGFNSFIIFMLPICMLQFGVLLAYLYFKKDIMWQSQDSEKQKLVLVKPKISIKDQRAKRRALFILGHMIFLFSISHRLSLNPAAIALLGALSLFLFSGLHKTKVVNRVGFNDILFFIGLFIVVGGLEVSGILRYVSQMIMTLFFESPTMVCLVLMWIAAAFTAFLSAGPTTALFFPIVLGVGIMPPNNIIWWALSLGVLAGSSATMMGATAGPVATTLVENFSAKYRLNLTGGNTISYTQFTRIGIPVMFIFLTISSIYIFGLCMTVYR